MTESAQRNTILTLSSVGFTLMFAVWLMFGILEALIALRIGLKLIGANPESPIVALIYGFTYLFLFPFEGLVPSPTAGSMVLELSSMFAMLIYGLIAWAVERTIWLVFYRPRGPVVGVNARLLSSGEDYRQYIMPAGVALSYFHSGSPRITNFRGRL